MTNASHAAAPARSDCERRLTSGMRLGRKRRGSHVAVEKDLVHPAPLEVSQQLLQAALHAVEVDVVTKPRAAADAGNARLEDVDLPGVEVEDGGPLLGGIHPG